MTTAVSTVTRPNIGTGVIYAWTLAPGDDGAPAEEFNHADRSAQVTGIAGHSVSIQGSNDGANWAVLTDPIGNPLTFSSDGIRAITECTRYMRPIAAGGAGNVVVSLFGRK